MIPILYSLALISLIIGTAAIYMALIKVFPVEWLYYHYFIRKPIVWTIFIMSLLWTIYITLVHGSFPTFVILPLIIMGLAVVLSYRMHQENAFPAVDYPEMAEDIESLPIEEEMQLAVIEYEGVTKAYPLDYVVHHHIVNDRFGERIVALTYCAMCRSIIPFDVTDIGPLFVGSFKGANMIVADRKTKTFFQQATFESIIGELHPNTLTMLPFQILPWSEVKKIDPLPAVAKVTEKDFKDFELPIPGIWKKIVASESTPGISAKERDTSFPARTHVVGITDKIANPQVVYLKEEVLPQGIVNNEELGIFLVGFKNTINAFMNGLEEKNLEITLTHKNALFDRATETTWDIRGKYLSGEIKADLIPVAFSDEYWFSWKLFHPKSELIRLK